jgi:MarR family transcriptional regulator for hemolysin
MTIHSPSPRSRFGFQFVMLARRWRQTLDEKLKAVGFTDATWTPLVHLRESGDGISQKDLAVRVGLDGSSLVRLLDILAARGLVERRTDETDRRAKLVFLTEAGRMAVADIRHVLTAAEMDMLADLSEGEISAMLGVFDKIDLRLQHIRDALGPAS